MLITLGMKGLIASHQQGSSISLFFKFLMSSFYLQSLVTIGAILGSPVGGWAIDKFGRKSTIMLCVVPFVLGWLLISFAQNIPMLYSGRIITGMGCGAVSLAVPVSSYVPFYVPSPLLNPLTL